MYLCNMVLWTLHSVLHICMIISKLYITSTISKDCLFNLTSTMHCLLWLKKIHFNAKIDNFLTFMFLCENSMQKLYFFFIKKNQNIKKDTLANRPVSKMADVFSTALTAQKQKVTRIFWGFIVLGIHNFGLYMENILLYIFSWLEYMAGVLSFFKTEKTKWHFYWQRITNWIF